MKITVLCMLSATFSSCGKFDSKDEKPVNPMPAGHTPPAGIVEKVSTTGGYVFIRRYGALKLKDNDVLESRGGGRTANLFPTGENLGERVAADIRSGDVRVGDAVYVRRAVTNILGESGEQKYELTP